MDETGIHGTRTVWALGMKMRDSLALGPMGSRFEPGPVSFFYGGAVASLHAYCHIIVCPEVLGTSWTNDAGNLEFYVDHVLPFGLRISENLFDILLQGLNLT